MILSRSYCTHFQQNLIPFRIHRDATDNWDRTQNNICPKLVLDISDSLYSDALGNIVNCSETYFYMQNVSKYNQITIQGLECLVGKAELHITLPLEISK